MADEVRRLLDRYGDQAVRLDTTLRTLHREGRTSDALVAIAQAFDQVAIEATDSSR